MGAVIFDLDGTLADTSQDLLNAANRCFEALGYDAPLVWPDDRMVAFHGGRKMLSVGIERIKGILDQGFVDAKYKPFLAHYDAAIAVETRFFDGAEDALAALKDAGHRLGICTNKPIALAEKLLAELGQRHWFEVVLGADSLPVRKPDPAHYWGVLERMGYSGPSLLVGDTVTDLKTARAAGVPCVLCDFGDLEEGAKNFTPAATMTDYRDLNEIVDRVLNAG